MEAVEEAEDSKEGETEGKEEEDAEESGLEGEVTFVEVLCRIQKRWYGVNRG